LAAIDDLTAKLGGITIEVLAPLRPIYHAATVLASNCLVALLHEAKTVLEHCGLQGDDIERLLSNLSMSAIERIHKSGAKASLSGPIRRGDSNTVAGHLEALKEYENLEEIYRVLGKAALRLTERIGDTSPEDLTIIENLLKK
jgi:predicted short-subunit dehydrogenase-like oxidoreductase (DUF2520 family)